MPNTLSELIEVYRTDQHSSFFRLSHSVRVKHERLLLQIVTEHGSCLLKKIRPRDLLAWHAGWLGNTKIAKAHSLMSRLRVIFRFGATILEDKECRRLVGTLADMQFKRSSPRRSALSPDQAAKLRLAAREHFGWYSLALAQAFQFELRLNQKAVIGEWVPSAERGSTDTKRKTEGGEESWRRGLLWSNIDELFVLHSSGRQGKEYRFDLKRAPMVMEELAIYAYTSIDQLTRSALPANGPVIINDVTGLPWSPAEFRRKWRKVATQAGIPKHVMNMDSGKSLPSHLQPAPPLDAS